MLLSSVDTIEVIAEAVRDEQACKLFIDLNPDVVVMDLSMPGIGGLEGIRRICACDPEAKIPVFGIHDEMVYINRVFAAGAKGYITKNSAPEILITAVHEIAGGGIFIESGLKTSRPGPLGSGEYQSLINSLTPKEFDVFHLLAKGLTTHEAARELCLGVNSTLSD